MDSSNLLFFFLLSFIFFACSSGSFVYDVKDGMQKSGKSLHPHRKELIQTTQHDFTTYPATPVTNPVTTPATPIITVPWADPGVASTPIPIPPAVDPLNPVTNPVTTPSTIFPPSPVPVVGPPAGTNAPAVPGQSWCVARGGLPESVIQVALDYACGIGGADCSPIQQGQSCYNPNTLQNHASYAFNSYFQKNPVQTSCDFGGTAMTTNVNPSSGSCMFTTWSSSSSSASPATMSPTTTTPAMDGAGLGSGTPPTVMNASNPALGGGATGFGEIPPTTATTSSGAVSSTLKPFVRCIAVAVSIVIGSSYWTLIYI